MSKQYTTVKDLVFTDLKKRDFSDVKDISQNHIDGYFQDLVRTKAHLCATSIKFSTVNRYVERFIKTNANN